MRVDGGSRGRALKANTENRVSPLPIVSIRGDGPKTKCYREPTMAGARPRQLCLAVLLPCSAADGSCGCLHPTPLCPATAASPISFCASFLRCVYACIDSLFPWRASVHSCLVASCAFLQYLAGTPGRRRALSLSASHNTAEVH